MGRVTVNKYFVRDSLRVRGILITNRPIIGVSDKMANREISKLLANVFWCTY